MSSWVGFHASMSLTTNASTPTASGSDITQTTTADAPADVMSLLENALHQVEFCDLNLDEDDMRTTPIPNDTPPVPAPILPVSHLMHGRLTTQTDTLWSLATGSKKILQCSGN
jgi:hypothetical protein